MILDHGGISLVLVHAVERDRLLHFKHNRARLVPRYRITLAAILTFVLHLVARMLVILLEHVCNLRERGELHLLAAILSFLRLFDLAITIQKPLL